MSTFTKYLTEATKTYEYKIKIAGDIDQRFWFSYGNCTSKI